MLLFNSLSEKLEPFKPNIDGEVKMYVCGMTVYDLCHLGHARSLISFDVIRKQLLDMSIEIRDTKDGVKWVKLA